VSYTLNQAFNYMRIYWQKMSLQHAFDEDWSRKMSAKTYESFTIGAWNHRLKSVIYSLKYSFQHMVTSRF